MNSPGAEPDDNLLVRARAALLDCLEALRSHRRAIIIIGAQAIYLRTPAAPVALAESTKDSDIALDPRKLGEHPLIEAAMTGAGFVLNPVSQQPGAWQTPQGIPVDLMVPEELAGPGGRTARGARLPPHAKRSMRRARGLEAALVDNSVEQVGALDPQDSRTFSVKVAGPAALLVAKSHKLVERLGSPDRLNDKDAHDVYRILRAIETDVLAAAFERLLADDLSRTVASEAVTALRDHLAPGPEATFAMMAGRAEEGIGEPQTVALATALLGEDLLALLPNT